MERFNLNYRHGDYDEADHYDSSVTFNVEHAYLWDILEKVEQFLRGSGFHFDGSLKIVGNNETIVPTSFVSDTMNTNKQRFSDVGSPVEVTKSFEQGINITNTGNVASPAYPDEGFDAWGKAVEKARKEADAVAWNRGQTAV